MKLQHTQFYILIHLNDINDCYETTRKTLLITYFYAILQQLYFVHNTP